MQSGDKILAYHGQEFTVLKQCGPDTLVSYETTQGMFYMIAWNIHETENGRFHGNKGITIEKTRKLHTEQWQPEKRNEQRKTTQLSYNSANIFS